jgi:hypothetical protein
VQKQYAKSRKTKLQLDRLGAYLTACDRKQFGKFTCVWKLTVADANATTAHNRCRAGGNSHHAAKKSQATNIEHGNRRRGERRPLCGGFKLANSSTIPKAGQCAFKARGIAPINVQQERPSALHAGLDQGGTGRGVGQNGATPIRAPAAFIVSFCRAEFDQA